MLVHLRYIEDYKKPWLGPSIANMSIVAVCGLSRLRERALMPWTLTSATRRSFGFKILSYLSRVITYKICVHRVGLLVCRDLTSHERSRHAINVFDCLVKECQNSQRDDKHSIGKMNPQNA